MIRIYCFHKTEKDIAIDDVLLPKWAYGGPQIFIWMHRDALECEFVSKNNLSNDAYEQVNDSGCFKK